MSSEQECIRMSTPMNSRSPRRMCSLALSTLYKAGRWSRLVCAGPNCYRVFIFIICLFYVHFLYERSLFFLCLMLLCASWSFFCFYLMFRSFHSSRGSLQCPRACRARLLRILAQQMRAAQQGQHQRCTACTAQHMLFGRARACGIASSMCIQTLCDLEV